MSAGDIRPNVIALPLSRACFVTERDSGVKSPQTLHTQERRSVCRRSRQSHTRLALALSRCESRHAQESNLRWRWSYLMDLRRCTGKEEKVEGREKDGVRAHRLPRRASPSADSRAIRLLTSRTNEQIFTTFTRGAAPALQSLNSLIFASRCNEY